MPVKALPGASSSGLRGEHGGLLKVAITQVAEKGKANHAIAALLAKTFGLRKNQIELLTGTTSTQKRFLIHDCSLEELRERLEMHGL